jgi:GTP pyrophosphokinase
MGVMILEREMKVRSVNVNGLLKDGTLKKIAEGFSLKSPEDLLSEIGYGKISAKKVMTRLFPKEEAEQVVKPKESPLQKIAQEAAKKSTTRNVVKVKGIDDLLVRFAHCCNPVPGDSVVGFITRGRGISVHARTCPKIFDTDPHRLIDIDWDVTKKTERNVKIRIVCEDRPGLLADMSNVIRNQNVNIKSARIGTTKDKKALCIFSIQISDLGSLRKVISTLEGVDGVISVTRVQKKETAP